MGQYHKPVNITKREFIDPHKFGDGLKLLEFGASGSGTMLGLAILLNSSRNRGGGDLPSELPIVGSWAGDNIAILGDYSEKGDIPSHPNLMYSDLEGYKDVSGDVLRAMLADSYIKHELREMIAYHDWTSYPEWDTLFTKEEIEKTRAEQEAKRKAEIAQANKPVECP